MPFDMMRRAISALFLFGMALHAQDAELAVKPPQDSAIARARQLVLDGHAADGRRMIDSLMQTGPGDPSIYAEALFWRGALATNAADAERDYRRLLIEAPFAPRAEDALVQLAQLVQARGDRKTASDHLYRYMISYGNSPDRPARPRVALWLVRLLFEQDQLGRGCEALRMGRDAVPAENVELRNQLEAYAPRCAYGETTPVEAVAPADTAVAHRAPETDTARAAPAPKASTTRAAAKPPFYSVQVAAYDSREAAARMADVLVSRGVEARVDGVSRPFRVRVGKYATRADAVKAAQALKAQGQNGFVTLVTAGPRS